MASQAASPTSSTSTMQRRQESSASPRLSMTTSGPTRLHFGPDPAARRPKSFSPPTQPSNKPGLAPPASIQPATGPSVHARRNSNPRYTPRLLTNSLSQSSSPQTLAHPSSVNLNHLRTPGMVDGGLISPHQNVREQDAIETLLFMSSPGNSANMKHSFTPTGSPAPTSTGALSRSNPKGRHALPGGPRKALPSQRPAHLGKQVGFDESPAAVYPGSPMELDSPHHAAASPHRRTPKRRVNGVSSHLRGALSLPSGLGVSDGSSRRRINDAYVENMLERAAAESSDEEDILLPRQRPETTA